MAAVTVPVGRMVALLPPLVLAVLVGLACVVADPTGSAPAGASTNGSTTSRPSTPLKPPRTTDAQDTKFFIDVAEADPALASYEQKQKNVALRALLTDGSAFCALLTRSGGLDAALVEEATGVRGTETQTHLPLSVTTFNTIESVALLILCPAEQRLLPTSVRAKIRTLGKSLGKRRG